MATAITRQFLTEARIEMESALAEFAAKHGIKVSVGGATFSAANATFKVELASIADSGTVMTKKASDFTLYATMHGLKAEDLGRVFSYAGKQYKITGLMPRASRFPVIAERLPDGKAFKLPVAAVKMADIMAQKN